MTHTCEENQYMTNIIWVLFVFSRVHEPNQTLTSEIGWRQDVSVNPRMTPKLFMRYGMNISLVFGRSTGVKNFFLHIVLLPATVCSRTPELLINSLLSVYHASVYRKSLFPRLTLLFYGTLPVWSSCHYCWQGLYHNRDCGVRKKMASMWESDQVYSINFHTIQRS